MPKSTSLSSVLKPTVKKKGFLYYLKRDYILYLLLVPPVFYYILFKYVPMHGIIIAFKDFNIFKGVMASHWVGLKYFKIIFAMPEFFRVVRNTLMLNMLDLLIGFPAPIILAIMLAEIQNMSYRRVAQTILYLPHFISWVVIAGMVLQLFSPDSGLVNVLIRRLGGSTVSFLTEKWHWLGTYLAVGLWQGVGWGSIIYIATISGIPPELYEAAIVDGAGRFQRIWNITLPSIRPTIVMLLILRMGSMLSIGFEKPYLLGNTMVREFSDVISTYVYRIGLESSEFSIATAVGLMQSAVGMTLILTSNAIANKVNDSGIF